MNHFILFDATMCLSSNNEVVFNPSIVHIKNNIYLSRKEVKEESNEEKKLKRSKKIKKEIFQLK